MMNCTTIMPDDHPGIEKERDRRTSRGITACLRGETEDYYDYEADGMIIFFKFIVLYCFWAAIIILCRR